MRVGCSTNSVLFQTRVDKEKKERRFPFSQNEEGTSDPSQRKIFDRNPSLCDSGGSVFIPLSKHSID